MFCISQRASDQVKQPESETHVNLSGINNKNKTPTAVESELAPRAGRDIELDLLNMKQGGGWATGRGIISLPFLSQGISCFYRFIGKPAISN